MTMIDSLVLPKPLRFAKPVLYQNPARPLECALAELGIKPFSPTSVFLFKFKQGTILYFKAWGSELSAAYPRHNKSLRGVLYMLTVMTDYLTRPLRSSKRPHWYSQPYSGYIRECEAVLHDTGKKIEPPVAVRNMVAKIRYKTRLLDDDIVLEMDENDLKRRILFD